MNQWRRFEQAIERAITSCKQSGDSPEHHFAGAGKPITGGNGTVAQAAQDEALLSINTLENADTVLDADRAYLSDCLQHLAWRQMADVAEDHNTGDVIVTFRGDHPAGSEATPALSTEQWRSD